MSVRLMGPLVVGACIVFAAFPVRADIAPPPGYVESCTLQTQQRSAEECTMCRAARVGSSEECQKLSAVGYEHRCSTRGASVWAEMWCRPKTKRPSQGKFSPQAWRQAVDPKSSDWSREALLTQFVEEYKLDGMERDKVISLLGEPAHAIEFYPGGDRSARSDTYCLSAKDER